MRKIAAVVLAILCATPLAAQIQDETGAVGAFVPDRPRSAALGALNAAVTVDVSGRDGVGGYVTTGTLSGTVIPEVTIDGTNWLATSVYDFTAGAAPARATAVTLNRLFAIEIPAGAKQARIRVSVYTSGTSTGYLIATSSSGSALSTLGGGGGTSSSFGSAFPASGTAAGHSDGTNMQGSRVFDTDSGAGFEYTQGVVLRGSSSGGSFELGTGTNPLRINPTGATAQPVNGTITANAGSGTFTVAGNKTNNAAAPGATNVGVLGGLANAAAPSWTEGNLVALSTDLAGALRVTGAGGGVQYTEADVDATITGTAVMWEDTADTLRAVSAAKPLPMTCISGCGGPATFADNSAFTFGTTSISNVGFVLDDVATNAATENSAAAARISTNRMQLFQLGDGAGNERRANVTASNALAVDGSAVTQPISAASLPLPTGASTLAEQQTQTTSLQLIDNLPLAQASTTSGQSGVLAQGAVTTAAPTYTTGQTDPLSLTTTGSLRVDGSGVTQPVSGTVAISQTTTENDVDVTTLPNEGQQTAANSISTTPDTDNDPIGATGAAPPGEAVMVGGLSSGATGGFLQGITVCDSFYSVDIVTATTVLAVTGVSGRHVYICSWNFLTAGANNVAIVAGTGATCGTSTAGMNGGVTAAEGWNFAANGGLTQGSGIGAIARTETTGDSVCIITSAAVQLSGTISYTIY